MINAELCFLLVKPGRAHCPTSARRLLSNETLYTVNSVSLIKVVTAMFIMELKHGRRHRQNGVFGLTGALTINFGKNHIYGFFSLLPSGAGYRSLLARSASDFNVFMHQAVGLHSHL